MATYALVGEVTINGYKIVRELNVGGFASAFEARSKEGTKVFLKAYKSPSVAISWFFPYLNYIRELNARVADPQLQRFCVRQIDSFLNSRKKPSGAPGPEHLCQVYEFVEGGHDLDTILQKLRKDPAWLKWDQQLILAKVLMAGINQLHIKDIVHCDLKPANLQMLENKSIEAGYELKLIDMDFSILADKQAPWHGTMGYVGSPSYRSPEHVRNEVPTKASDVFTCGIILHELLTQSHAHPFPFDEEEYEKRILSSTPPKVTLRDGLSSPEATAHLAGIIGRCLDQDPKKRPSALEVNQALNGRMPSRADVSPAPPVIPPVGGTNAAGAHLSLVAGNGVRQTYNIRTNLGKALLAVFGEDSRFADDHQFTVDKRGTDWFLLPRIGTTNHSLLNGRPLLREAKLMQGDVIAIGSRNSDKVVMELKVA